MERVWFVLCPDPMSERIRDEVRRRDGRAGIVRVRGAEEAKALAQAVAPAPVIFAVGILQGGGGAISELEAIAMAYRSCEIVLFAERTDSETVARGLQAGATEIIMLDDGLISQTASLGQETHMGERPSVDAVTPPGCGDDLGRTGFLDDGAEAGLQALESLSSVGDGMLDGLGIGSIEAEERYAAQPPACSGAPVPAGGGAAPAGTGRAPDRPIAEAQVPDEAPPGPQAPVVTVISGRGGVGKTAIACAMAACAARSGMRVAVLDLDLMFGNAAQTLGADCVKGIESAGEHAASEGLSESDIEASAMRIGPGLTAWGPCALAERAELVSQTAERLLAVLRGAADVVIVDTSVHWGDAVAMAVAASDRCLVVGSSESLSIPSARKVIELAGRLGVPRTRMTCIFNRLGAPGSDEGAALRFEMGVSLRSRMRVAFGGEEVSGMTSFGHIDALVAGPGQFARSIRALTRSILQELGCSVDGWDFEEGASPGQERQRIRLPWVHKGDEGR